MLTNIIGAILEDRSDDLIIHLGRSQLAEAERQEVFIATLIANNIEAAKILLDHGMDINARDNNGNTPLCNAIDEIRFDHAKLLLLRGANLAHCDSDGYSPLHHVILVADNLSIAEVDKVTSLKKILIILLESGADIHQKSRLGDSPIELCDLLEIDWIKEILARWEH